jgi:glycosyltransferase involved in cell wall biosynthesis
MSLRNAEVAFIFSSDGWSLVEKGVMCILGRAARRGVVIRFGSGALPEQCRASPLLREWVRLVLRSAHVVSTQGPSWTQFFGSLAGSTAKIHEVANGVRMPGKAGASDRSGCRLAFAGWMQREKGIFEALEVFRLTQAHFPHATLTMAGGGRDLEVFRSRVRDLGLEAVVTTPGWLSPGDVRAMLARSDLFLFPSHYEGLPNAVLEAMAAGVPVVATRVGSLPDVVEDGQAGFLLPVGDVEGLARAVRSILGSPAEMRRLGTNAERVARRFDIEAVWPQHLRSIQTAADAARNRTSRPREW